MEVSASYPFPRERPFELPAEFVALGRATPVAPVRLFDGSAAWLVTGHEEARAVLGDHRVTRRPIRELAHRQFADAGFDFGAPIAEPPGHTRWRRMVNKAFGARQAEAMRARVGELVDELLGGMADSGPPVDAMAAFAFRLPIAVLCELLGVPDGGRRHFREWAAAIRGVTESLDSFGPAMRGLGEYAAELVAQRRAPSSARQPGDDVLGRLLTVRDADGRPFSDEEVVATVQLMAIGGYETMAVQFGNGLFDLLRHPEQADRLRRDPGLVPAAVEEILRHAQASTGLAGAMQATADVEVGGVTIPAGATVFVSADAANRDERLFACPERFDVAREAASRHLSFGSGAHFCLGAPLARIQLQEGIRRMLLRFPGLRLATDPESVPFTSNLFAYYPRELPVTWLSNRRSCST